MKKDKPENFSNEEDYAIIQEILGGNINLFEKLQNKYRRALSLLINRMINDREEVRDIVQETFIRAYNNLRYFRKEYSFHSWIFKIASNLCIDYLRKRRLQTISIEKPFPTNEEEKHFDYPDKDADVYHKLITEEQSQVLHQAIEMLPDHYRQIIKLRHFEELDYQEIAERLSIPLGTVKVQLFRARKALLEILKAKRFEYGF